LRKDFHLHRLGDAKLTEAAQQFHPASADATIAYIKQANPSNKRIVIHYHPGKTYGPGLHKGLISDIGWADNDLRRVKLIK
jgi:hypothetical protein